MQRIKEDIKKKEFAPVYLLYGQESYLKNMYKNKLKEAIIAGDDGMNFSYFEGKDTEEQKVQDIADTLPFFAERRLIIIENSGWFKSSNTFFEYLAGMPPATHIVFVENEVDKRGKLFKYISKSGVAVSMEEMQSKDLVLWIAKNCQQNNKKIRESTVQYFLEYVEHDMMHMQNELEKLFAYAHERDEITKADIDAVCTLQLHNRIFEMIDAVGEKNRNKTLQLYYDLLALREKPMSILFLLIRHFRILLLVKEQEALHTANNLIAKKAGVPPFTIKKYTYQAKKFSSDGILSAFTRCVDTEESVKTGKVKEQLAVELLLLELSCT